MDKAWYCAFLSSHYSRGKLGPTPWEIEAISPTGRSSCSVCQDRLRQSSPDVAAQFRQEEVGQGQQPLLVYFTRLTASTLWCVCWGGGSATTTRCCRSYLSLAISQNTIFLLSFSDLTSLIICLHWSATLPPLLQIARPRARRGPSLPSCCNWLHGGWKSSDTITTKELPCHPKSN